MRRLSVILIFLGVQFEAQKTSVPIPTEALRLVIDFEADDYGNVYLYRQANFSVTKLDSLGQLQGRLMQAVPFRLQSVQNPLQLTMFSEGFQEVRLYDANLVEMQKIRLQDFGYIRAAYLQDQQMLWLADEAGRRIVQYNYRLNQLVNSTPFPEDLSSVQDFLYFDDKFYMLRANKFEVYDQNMQQLLSLDAKDAFQIRRDNATIFVIFPNTIAQFNGNQLSPLFPDIPGAILDKTSGRIYLLKDGNLSYQTL